MASHVRPDGDALGSTIAFALWLRSMRQDSHRVERAWGNAEIPLSASTRTDLGPGFRSARRLMSIVALDNSVKSRLGRVLDGVASVRTLINIDHHVSNEGYGDLNYVDPTAPATGQIIYEFFKEIGGTALS